MNRANVLKKNLSLGLITKILGMALSYVSLPIVLTYLGEENYGVWITIFSVISWLYNFDVGIGNGLKNKLTEALTHKDIGLARKYISTSYIIIIVITVILMIVGSFGIIISNPIEILNVDFLDGIYLKKVIFITFIFNLANFIISLYKQLFYAIHKSSFVGVANIGYQLLVIILITCLKEYYKSSLLMLTLAYGLSNLIIGIIFSVLFFKKRLELCPRFKFFDMKIIPDLMGIGIEFFIIQLSMIVIFTTDNLIITKLLGPEAVTSYNIILKFFQIFIMVATIILTPFWTLYTDAYIKKDKKWICRTLKNFNILYLLLTIVILTVVLNIDFFIKNWLSQELIYSKSLVVFSGLFALIRVYGDIYMYFLNGIGKIRVQLYLYILGALINIPLSVYFVKSLNLGSSGVILATNISMISFVVVMPIQSYYEIKKINKEVDVRKYEKET